MINDTCKNKKDGYCSQAQRTASVHVSRFSLTCSCTVLNKLHAVCMYTCVHACACVFVLYGTK